MILCVHSFFNGLESSFESKGLIERFKVQEKSQEVRLLHLSLVAN